MSQTPAIVIDKLGTHLFRVTNNATNEVSLKWHWESLEAEVKVACAEYLAKQSKKSDKIDLVKETEAKVTKTRAAKATTAKKPAAKKPAAKKATTKKKETK